jgi:hypothetical protein
MKFGAKNSSLMLVFLCLKFKNKKLSFTFFKMTQPVTSIPHNHSNFIMMIKRNDYAWSYFTLFNNDSNGSSY